MTRVFLARHGATAWNGNEARYCGVTDLPLTETGHEQAAALARRLADEPLAAVVATSLIRTQETARPIAEGHGVDVEISEGLRELDYGDWEGLTPPEIEERFPEAARERRQNMVDVAVPGGESLRQLLDRALPAFLGFLRRFEGKQIAITAHNTTNRALLCHLLDAPVAHYRRIVQSPGCLNVIEVEGDRACAVAINECCHLKGL